MTKHLFIGLGNAGPKYAHTRHNLGIDTLNAWLDHLRTQSDIEVTDWRNDTATHSQMSEVKAKPRSEARSASTTGGQMWQATCLFPLTMMNNSGHAVAAYLKNNPIDLANILLLHDDLELPLATAQHTQGGSAKGHNGVRSIHQALNTSDVPRLRLGLGRPPMGVEPSDFVLDTFTPDEQLIVQQMIDQAIIHLNSILKDPR